MGCTSSNKIDRYIDETLKKAADNAPELERVLQYYANDKEKLDAAKYIIANLGNSNTVDGVFMDSIEYNLKSLEHVYISDRKINPEFKDQWQNLYINRLDTTDDCKTIKSDYIISNIEHAYNRWKNKPWNRGLDFKHFCDLLLPIKNDNEHTSDWKDLFCKKYEFALDSLYNGDDPIEACRTLKKIIYEDRTHILISELSYPHRSAKNLLNCSVGNCRDECDFLTYAMRACGIPVITDFYLSSPDNFLSHYWAVLYDWKSNQYIPYNETDPKREDQEWDGRKKGKVYRSFWGVVSNIDTYDVLEIGNRKAIDVTHEYFGKNIAEVPLVEQNKRDLYLGVYHRPGWKSIGIGKKEGRNVIFYNIEPGVIYCALDEFNRPVSMPFIYEKNGILNSLIPDKNNTHSVYLTRKWPVTIMLRHEWLSDDHIGGSLTAYNDTDAGYDTLCLFTDTLPSNFISVDVDSKKPYSHVKYTAPKEEQVTIAEITFFRDEERRDTVLYTAKAENTDDQSGIKYINDNDIITYYKAPIECESAIFSFGKPTILKKIEFVPRNDDNYVWPGQEYELLFYDTDGQWVSLGRKLAADHYLTYDNVPDNALLLLRNHSKGKAEQVFIWRNNKQMFSIDL